jgi:hypothetical protein
LTIAKGFLQKLPTSLTVKIKNGASLYLSGTTNIAYTWCSPSHGSTQTLLACTWNFGVFDVKKGSALQVVSFNGIDSVINESESIKIAI